MRINYRKKEVQTYIDREGNARTPKIDSIESRFILDKGFKLVFYDSERNKITDLKNIKFI